MIYRLGLFRGTPFNGSRPSRVRFVQTAMELLPASATAVSFGAALGAFEPGARGWKLEGVLGGDCRIQIACDYIYICIYTYIYIYIYSLNHIFSLVLQRS